MKHFFTKQNTGHHEPPVERFAKQPSLNAKSGDLHAKLVWFLNDSGKDFIKLSKPTSKAHKYILDLNPGFYVLCTALPSELNVRGDFAFRKLGLHKKLNRISSEDSRFTVKTQLELITPYGTLLNESFKVDPAYTTFNHITFEIPSGYEKATLKLSYNAYTLIRKLRARSCLYQIERTPFYDHEIQGALDIVAAIQEYMMMEQYIQYPHNTTSEVLHRLESIQYIADDDMSVLSRFTDTSEDSWTNIVRTESHGSKIGLQNDIRRSISMSHQRTPPLEIVSPNNTINQLPPKKGAHFTQAQKTKILFLSSMSMRMDKPQLKRATTTNISMDVAHGQKNGDSTNKIVMSEARRKAQMSHYRRLEKAGALLQGQPSKILSPLEFSILVSLLPQKYQMRSWKILYDLQTHGANPEALMNQSDTTGPQIVLIQDDDGTVFGGFVAEGFHNTYGKFKSSAFSFVFRFNPENCVFKQYKWVGANDYVYSLSQNGIGMGGGSAGWAFWLDESLLMGSSGESETFDNKLLASTDIFRCLHMEIIGY